MVHAEAAIDLDNDSPLRGASAMVHAEAAIDLDNDSPLRGASAMVPADEEPAVRIDKHGGTWSGRRQASNGKSLADIVSRTTNNKIRTRASAWKDENHACFCVLHALSVATAKVSQDPVLPVMTKVHLRDQ